MKKWPEDPTETVYFNDLIAPVKKALLHAYRLTPKIISKDIPYDGYDTPSSSSTSHNPKDTLSAKYRKYHREQGRRPIDLILQIAFSLGFEQGVRYQSQETSKVERYAEHKERLVDIYVQEARKWRAKYYEAIGEEEPGPMTVEEAAKNLKAKLKKHKEAKLGKKNTPEQ